jgi:serine/threonine-protein kinase
MPDTIGPYRITGVLGEGGMGVVYAGHDDRLDRPVAIKTVRTTGVGPDAHERLKREARVAASVNHPNVCQLYEIGEDSSGLYIAMELLEGEPLSVRISRGALPVAEAVGVAGGMLAALAAMHRRGIVHRDLKPSNVFLTEHGVKLLDFGLARPLVEQSDQTLLTAPGIVFGTPHYMSPEQAAGRPADTRSDIFAVSATLYEMLAGRPPFQGSAAVQVLHAVMYDHPPVLTGSPAIVAADRMIHRALAKKPEDRYQTAEQFAEALRTLQWPSGTADVVQARPVTRLIVLPFRVLRPDPDVDFLSFSLADAITASLSALGSVVVRSSLTAAKYASEPDLATIAREADVDDVLSGTLLRAGDRVRVTTQLANAAGGAVAWSRSLDVSLGDIFQLQDTIVRSVVDALVIPLSARDQRQLSRDVPATVKAYEYYLRATELSRDNKSWATARDLYLQALAEDPRYAPAWARLGRLYRMLSKYASEDAAANLARSEHAFRRALEISPDLAMAHNLYAQLEVDLGRGLDALARLLGQARDRAADPELFAGLCHTCRYCGLLEASVSAHEQARRLDPKAVTTVVHTHYVRREFERVASEASASPHIGALALAELGRHAEALDLVRQVQATGPPLFRNFLEVARAFIEGRPADCVAALRQSVPQFSDPEALYHCARQYALLGEEDEAIVTFTRAVEGGYYCYPAFATDAWLDGVRGQAAFESSLRLASERHHAAVEIFRQAEGDRLLGVRA